MYIYVYIYYIELRIEMYVYIYTYIYIRHRACANGVPRVSFLCFPHVVFCVFYCRYVYCRHIYCRYVCCRYVYCRYVYCRYIYCRYIYCRFGIVCVKGSPHFCPVVTTCVTCWCHILALICECILVICFSICLPFGINVRTVFYHFDITFFEHCFRIGYV